MTLAVDLGPQSLSSQSGMRSHSVNIDDEDNDGDKEGREDMSNLFFFLDTAVRSALS